MLDCREYPAGGRDMANKKFVVKLSGEERERLREVISRGKAKAKSILKARFLMKADQGWADQVICRALDTNISMVARVRETLVTQGLDAVLTRKSARYRRLSPCSMASAKLSSSHWPAPNRRPRPLDEPPLGRTRRRTCRERPLQYGRPGR
jgi:hypothetical protein